MTNDIPGGPAAEAAVKSGDLRYIVKEPQHAPGGPTTYLVGLRVAAGKTIGDYFDLKSNKVRAFALGSGHVHPNDSDPRLWSWSEVWCPTGPPCS